MVSLYFEIAVHNFSPYGIWKWEEKDYKESLNFSFVDAALRLYFEKPYFYKKNEIEISPSIIINLHFPNISEDILISLNQSNEIPLWFAEKVYSYCNYAYEQFQALLITKAKLPKIIFHQLEDIHYLFDPVLSRFRWWASNTKPASVKVIFPKQKRITGFSRKRSIDINQWKKLQEAVSKNDMVSPELLELLKIKSRLLNETKKIAVIEATILAETLLREYSKKMLKKLGFSNNSIKNLSDEFNFNTMLNIIFPITLPRNSSKKLQGHINSINSLRKIRNDIVHGNITETEIENHEVNDGIESVIKIIALIKDKLKIT